MLQMQLLSLLLPLLLLLSPAAKPAPARPARGSGGACPTALEPSRGLQERGSLPDEAKRQQPWRREAALLGKWGIVFGQAVGGDVLFRRITLIPVGGGGQGGATGTGVVQKNDNPQRHCAISMVLSTSPKID